ncbi:hypothetical protein H6789_01180 [Candidatus Nomurabacteria bacterium]|nr:hypothetical protein [Candidatus Nomurabacteria bacterium]
METAIIIVIAVLQSIGVSLGVGSSTIAITQFFIAINDGKIDKAERRMMEVAYIVLRVAMGLILVTALAHMAIVWYVLDLQGLAIEQYWNTFTLALWVIIAVLFTNAFAMTKHWVPSTLGPGIQGGSWYTLGILFALVSIGVNSFTVMQFLLAYAGMVCLFIAVVNGVMACQRD